MRLRRLLVAAFVAVLAPATAHAASPYPPLPPATYQTVSSDVFLPMDDGVRIAMTVTRPSLDGVTPAPGNFPVILGMTPYGRDGTCSCPSAATFAPRGIAVAVADVRGTGGSGGNLNENYFSPREQKDGAALVEWLGTQSWSNGKVGMAGGSYVGITQYLVAEQQPPHLAAIAPAVALADVYEDAFTHAGIPDFFFDAQYIAVQGGPGLLTPNKDPAALPQTIEAKTQQAQGTPIALDYVARPNDGPFYRDRSPWYRADRIKVPVLAIDGWRDGFVRGNLEMYEALAKRKGVETRINVGGCTHKGCGAPFAPMTNPPDQDNGTAMQFEFFRKYLIGDDTAPRSSVRYFVQGENAYRESTAWPPRETEFVRFYLEDGAITPAKPKAPGAASYFTNPTEGLSMAFDEYGTIAISPYVPTDQRAESEQGVTWRTPPLKHSLTLAGPTQLHLVASSTAPDTDWIAKLADVAPDGSESIITEGYLRASHRALDKGRSTVGNPYHDNEHPTPLEPGAVYPFDIAIYPTAYRLAAGHRLQLRLTTFDMPTHLPATVQVDRNDPSANSVVPLSPATNTVQEGGKRPSSLLLPILAG
jgi:putative CocE/NonD family hydrolase